MGAPVLFLALASGSSHFVFGRYYFRLLGMENLQNTYKIIYNIRINTIQAPPLGPPDIFWGPGALYMIPSRKKIRAAHEFLFSP